MLILINLSSTKEIPVALSGLAPSSLVPREEYKLTALSVHSRTMMLNGVELKLTSKGDTPPMKPVTVNDPTIPVVAGPLSVTFVNLLNAGLSNECH